MVDQGTSTASLAYLNIETITSFTTQDFEPNKKLSNESIVKSSVAIQTTFIPSVEEQIQVNITMSSSTSKDTNTVQTDTTKLTNISVTENKASVLSLFNPFMCKGGKGLGRVENENDIYVVLGTWDGKWLSYNNYDLVDCGSKTVDVNQKWELILTGEGDKDNKGFSDGHEYLSLRTYTGKFLSVDNKDKVSLSSEVGPNEKFKFVFSGYGSNGDGSGDEVGGQMFLSLRSWHNKILCFYEDGEIVAGKEWISGWEKLRGWNY